MERFTIAMPVELADQLRDRVATGEFSDLNDAVIEALRDFDDLAAPVSKPAEDDWIRQHVVPAVEAYRRDPSPLRTVEQVRATLAAARERRAAGQ